MVSTVVRFEKVRGDDGTEWWIAATH